MSRLEPLDVCCLGCSGTGKTLFLRRLLDLLEDTSSKDSSAGYGVPETSPTLGLGQWTVDLTPQRLADVLTLTTPHTLLNAHYQRSLLTASKQIVKSFPSITFREAGGSMKKLWEGTITKSNVVLFLIDLSAKWQLALSATELTRVMEIATSQRKQVIIILNKADILDEEERQQDKAMEDAMKYALNEGDREMKFEGGLKEEILCSINPLVSGNVSWNDLDLILGRIVTETIKEGTAGRESHGSSSDASDTKGGSITLGSADRASTGSKPGMLKSVRTFVCSGSEGVGIAEVLREILEIRTGLRIESRVT